MTLSFAVLLAWLPLLRDYIPVADDYVYTAILKSKGLVGYFQTFGIFRIIGHSLAILSTITIYYPALYGTLVVATHVVAVCLFFRVCQLVLQTTFISFILSLLLAIFPWGYQAMALASCYSYVLATAVFLANLIILINFSSQERKQNFAFFISYCLTWLSLMSNECLIFVLAISGCIVWTNKKLFGFAEVRRTFIKFYSGWAPLLGVFSYTVFYYLIFHFVTTAHPVKTLRWNSESIFSVYFYQWSNVHIFQPWLNPIARKFIFYGWNPTMLVVAGCVLVFFTVCLFLLMKNVSSNEGALLGKPNKTVLFYIIALLIGASLVYAIGGGYSLDTRKKYPLIPLLLLLFGWVWRNFSESKLKICRNNLFLLSILCAIGISTTWLNIGVWRYAIIRHNTLIDFLVANSIAGNIRVEWDPDLDNAWLKKNPVWRYSWDSEDWVLNAALSYKGGQPVHIRQTIDSKLVWFDPIFSRWKLSNGEAR